MSAPLVKGWCPGAHRPMMSGDGLVVRVRPRLARLTSAQVLGLCAAAQRYGNGTIDLTNRANLQLRGVAEEAHGALLDDLSGLDLVDAEPGLETRRNILVSPFWQPGDVTERLATALLNRLAELPDLPAKFGFAIDTGTTRFLSGDPADIRLETGETGLILRADCAGTGTPVTEATAIDRLIDLARWFAAQHSPETRRMARLLRTIPLPEHFTGDAPGPATGRPAPGETPPGPCYGAPFGQLPARALARLTEASGARALRVTPWRLFLLEGGRAAPSDIFVNTGNTPLLTTDACAGAPLCPQAQVETREIARRLAPHVAGSLHVSGCAKGCARQTPADVTLVGRNGKFDLVKAGRAGDEPCRTGLDPETLSPTDLTDAL
ncbi:precorrin-3B synthase [Cribrihabitans marinus]|uniref:Precorrin-3B synthase n=1 Tax=Cribrihabitans marinus TaxID=1227549 RepID=A0A1H7B0C1_9RHOB|nr:cobalamin biosynthesis protein CobG [Cribrihabitans marinus]GGH32940.1 precorrin-3B synthase [Cribrihabitans marinus]SEJ71283.1 precorrin-3B synthase [Cribrihabitans marinus]